MYMTYEQLQTVAKENGTIHVPASTLLALLEKANQFTTNPLRISSDQPARLSILLRETIESCWPIYID